MSKAAKKLVREVVGGEPYEYYPLGDYIVAAPGICGGRPTFKYTRVEVEVVLDLLAAGESMERLVENFQGRIPREAIKEALRLAALRCRGVLSRSSIVRGSGVAIHKNAIDGRAQCSSCQPNSNQITPATHIGIDQASS